LFIG
jgi:hypothetical protein